MTESFITLHLKPNSNQRIVRGHRWAFAGEIAENLRNVRPSAAAALCEARGRLLGRGYVNPHSLIVFRMVTVGDEEWNDDLFTQRISAAWEYRQRVCPQESAYRLIYGESDGIPGLVVDNYNGNLAIQVLTAGIEMRLDNIIRPLTDLIQPQSITILRNSPYRQLERLPLQDAEYFGEKPEAIIFTDETARFIARPGIGQKTGFFLDQRVNRRILAQFAPNASILDLFCYTGSWAIKALLNGANRAILVDSSEKSLEWAKREADLNNISERCQFIKSDAWSYLEKCVDANERFDIIIVDPPSLISSRASIEAGTSAYKALNRLAVKALSPNGILVSCSCSHLMHRDAHLAVIGEAISREKRTARILYSGGQPPDHPILPGHPESEYLKCWILALD